MKIKVGGYKTLVELFNSLCGSKSLWEVFNDCISLFSLSFQNLTENGEKFKENEVNYKNIINKYDKSKQEIIIRIFAEITNKLEDNLDEEGYGKVSVDYKIKFDRFLSRRNILEIEVMPS